MATGHTSPASKPYPDTFVLREGHGPDTLSDFCPKQGHIAFDMNEISDHSDVQDRLSQRGEDTVLTFDNGDQIVLPAIKSSDLGPNNFTFSPGPISLLEGTLIQTERGEIQIENLRPDDIIWTKQRGWQALGLVTVEAITFRHRDDPAKPVLIPAGALGENQPAADLITSPHHRILQRVEGTQEEVLVPAASLIGINGIRRMRGKKSANYYNIVLERHSIIQAAGCWVESLHVTRHNIRRQTQAARKLLDHYVGLPPTQRVAPLHARKRHLKTA
jgi:hypothetical protein